MSADTEKLTLISPKGLDAPEEVLKGALESSLYSNFSFGAGIRALQIVLHSTLTPELRKKSINSYIRSWKVLAMRQLSEKRKELVSTLGEGAYTEEQLDYAFKKSLSSTEELIRSSLEESPFSE